MKRERVEDLGRISELMGRILDDYEELEHHCSSKHSVESFESRYKEHGMYELHTNLRFLFERLNEIRYIAMGDEEE